MSADTTRVETAVAALYIVGWATLGVNTAGWALGLWPFRNWSAAIVISAAFAVGLTVQFLGYGTEAKKPT